jgi:hypothetical protein
MNKQATPSRRRRGAMLAGLVISAGLTLFTSSAMAHGHVDWSLGIGVGGPAVVYQQPQVVYAQPPVVYEQVPVVQYRESYDWRREHAWREHERREWREHEWREHHGGRDWDDHREWRRD